MKVRFTRKNQCVKLIIPDRFRNFSFKRKLCKFVSSPMKILFLVPYPLGQAPSQRFRFEQYFQILTDNNLTFKVCPFLDEETWRVLYTDGNSLAKGLGVFRGFLRRVGHLFEAVSFDIIFIHREATPVGPPIFEWILSKVLRKKLIYDFDDAIWLPNTSVENRLIASIKNHGKVGSICKLSWKISCGNQFIADYAKQFNKNIILNPSTIDVVNKHNQFKDQPNGIITIGWTGTHSTSKYLLNIIPVLQELELENKFRFLIISNQNPNINLNSVEYRKWNKSSEIDDLIEIDIGLMPLDNDIWAEGKCGFKALQYLALQIPALVSPVGVNKSIVEEDINGYHCNTPADWKSNIVKLINNPKLRMKLGVEGRRKVTERFSVGSNTDNFVNLFSD